MNPDDIRARIENGVTFNLQNINFNVNEPTFITDNPADNTGFTQISGGYQNRYTYHSEKRLLHIAIERGNIAAVQILLNSGADPNIPIRHFRINTVTNPTGCTYRKHSERGVTHTDVFARPMIEALQQMINRLAPVAQIPQEPAVQAPQEPTAPAPQEPAAPAPQEPAVQVLLEEQMSKMGLEEKPLSIIGKLEAEHDIDSEENTESYEYEKKPKEKEKGKEIEPEYDADSESHGEKIRFRERLILGEANFSYTKSLIKKHENDLPGLPKFLTATELRDQKTLTDKYKDFEENAKYIQNKGGIVQLGANAKDIQKIQEKFPEKHFERIHFNAPYMKNPQQTRDLVGEFFISACAVQNDGDRVYMSLVDKKSNPYFWHGATYGIIEASAQAGYKLLTKRKLDKVRYEDYSHKETDNDSTSANAQFLKEFIFEKTALSPDEIKAEYKKLGILFSSTESFGTRMFFGKNESVHTPYDTADDSSDYVTEESQTPAPKMGFSKK